VPDAELRGEAAGLLRRLVTCDTSNPPGREAQAAAVVEDHLAGTGVVCERVAKDPERPNLVARLRGDGTAPSLAFLGHLDVVPVRREDWSVDPFAGVERDGAVWGRGSVDMKSQVAATTVALASLAREKYRPGGDLLLVLTADEEVGDAGVGAPFLAEARPDLCPDFVVGEGAGERIPTAAGPIYLLDRGVKATATATLTAFGEAGDASLPDTGASAVDELARLLTRLREYRAPVTVLPELEPLLDALGTSGEDEDRVAQAREAHAALDLILAGLVGSVFRPTVVEAVGPENVVPNRATATIQCILLPGRTRGDAEAELRGALGPGRYELDLTEPLGGSVSETGTPLQAAIEGFLAEHDPEARLVPCLGYGYSDCDVMRTAYGSVAYGFIPFRHADPLTNLTTKHAEDERVLVDDIEFQVHAARTIARAVTSADARPARPLSRPVNAS
jgi:acetylornithine deacetylase/succinyl-diaminopimelate desuccinylase-like protein